MFSLYTEQQYLGVKRRQEGIAETLSSNNPTDSQINAFLRREERLQAYEFVHCKTYKFKLGTDYSDPFSKYVTNSSYGTVDNKTVLDPEDDAAHVNWGGSWRMPTKEEQDELRTKCTWIWASQNGVNGRLVTGSNGKSIFLPAAGYRYGSSLLNVGTYSVYWSSSLDTGGPYDARPVSFDSDGYDRDRSYSNRSIGFPVRPVTE